MRYKNNETKLFCIRYKDDSVVDVVKDVCFSEALEVTSLSPSKFKFPIFLVKDENSRKQVVSCRIKICDGSDCHTDALKNAVCENESPYAWKTA